MAYKAKQIADKLIYAAWMDEANGGDRLTNLKLQKLMYYEQGYHLAAFGTPLFNEDVEAWMYGPVVPIVYNEFSQYGRNSLPVCNNKKEIVSLNDEEESLFYQVYDTYKEYSAIGLMNLTHKESPWLLARPHDKGTVISQESMEKYFKTRME